MPSGLSDSLGSSFGPLASYALAAVIVLVLILVVMFIAKRALRGGSVGQTLRKGPRLAVLDVTALDQRRKLVLVRRDEVEHLVLIGGQNDLLIESNILRVPAALRRPPQERAGTARIEPDPIAPGPTAGARNPAPVPAGQSRPLHPESQPFVRPPSPLRRQVPKSEPRPARSEPVAQPPIVSAAPRLAAENGADVPLDPPLPAEPAVSAPPVLLRPAPAPQLDDTTAEPAPQVPSAAAEIREEPLAPPLVFPEPEPVPARSAMREPEAQEDDASPRIPAFLRRTDAVRPAPAPQPVEPVIPPIVPAAPDPADIHPPATVSAPAAAPADPVAEPVRVEPEAPRQAEAPKPQAVDIPAPGLGAAVPVSEDVAPERPAHVEPPEEQTPLRPQPAAPPVLASAHADRDPEPSVQTPRDAPEPRPLSVRSFATVIQSRRQNFEALRAGDTWTGRAAQSLNAARMQPAPPSVPAASAGAEDPDEASLLDEALTRELDTGIGSLEWTDMPSRAPEKTEAPAIPEVVLAPKAPEIEIPRPPDVVSPQQKAPEIPAVQRAPEVLAPQRPPEVLAPQRAPEVLAPQRAPEISAPQRVPDFAAPPKPAKPQPALTLEEEMERLLGDFDMNNSRR